MLFTTADAAARGYLTLLERSASPRSASLTISAGRAYAPSCRACSSRDRVTGPSRTGSVERCRRCGCAWSYENVELPRTMAGRSHRHDGREAALCDLATMGVLLGRLKCWERRALLLYATGAYSQPELLEECRRRWPRRCTGWTLSGLRADLADARVALERSLKRAGLLAA